MSVLSEITIDWSTSPRIITVADTITEVTCQDIYDSCRWLESTSVAMEDASIITGAGKEELGAGVTVGLTITLLNALVAFEARTGPEYIQCNIAGGNCVAKDEAGDYTTTPVHPTAYTQVVVTASSSATSTEQADIQNMSFNGGVTIDLLHGLSGIEYPAGNAQYFSNNMVDALAISILRHKRTFFVNHALTLDTYAATPGYSYIGSNPLTSLITVEAEADVTNCQFLRCTLSGELDGVALIDECTIANVSNVSGICNNSQLEPGTFKLGTGVWHVIDCSSGLPGSGTPTIDFNHQPCALGMRGYNGGIKLINKSSSESVSIDLASGQIKIDMTTVTNGTIVCRGDGKLIDADTGISIPSGTYGSLVIINELTNVPKIAQAVMESSIESNLDLTEALKLITAALAGKISGSGTGTIAIRDTNDTKDVITATVDANGNRLSVVRDVS